MEYREIVAVTGIPGLFQLLRSVADKTTKFISARKHNVTPLESIEVYTTGENIRLDAVFGSMLKQEETYPSAEVKTSDNNAIRGYFKQILPEMDEDRVYVSDMKKMLRWYDLLKSNDLLRFEAEVPAEGVAEGETTTEVAAQAETAENPA